VNVIFLEHPKNVQKSAYQQQCNPNLF